MKATTIFLPGLVLASGLVLNCSSSSGAPTPLPPSTVTPGAGSGATGVGGAGTSATAGSPDGGGSPGTAGSVGSAGSAGSGPAGSGGATCAMGIAGTGVAKNAAGKCVPGALAHDDMLCYCQPTTLTQYADGCFDPQTDPDHCGTTCATKCGATQVCSAGKCGVTPTTLVPAAAGCKAIRLALSGTTLYWTDTMHGTVKSIATTAGATAKTISSTELAPTLIIANGMNVFWLATGGKNAIMKSVAGAAPTAVYTATTTDPINGFTVSADGNTVYFTLGTKLGAGMGAGISKIAATGGTVTEVGHEDSGIPHALAVDGMNIGYPTDVNGDVDVMTMGAAPAVCASPDSTTAMNSNCNRVARSQGSLNFEAMLLSGGNAYWGNQSQIQMAAIADPNGVDSTVASADPSASSLPAISFNNGSVFFGDDVGFIYKAPLMKNATVTEIARAQMGTTSVVGDDANAYWATGDCAIMTSPVK
jgi:hypothetical protein